MQHREDLIERLIERMSMLDMKMRQQSENHHHLRNQSHKRIRKWLHKRAAEMQLVRSQYDPVIPGQERLDNGLIIVDYVVKQEIALQVMQEERARDLEEAVARTQGELDEPKESLLARLNSVIGACMYPSLNDVTEPEALEELARILVIAQDVESLFSNSLTSSELYST